MKKILIFLFLLNSTLLFAQEEEDKKETANEASWSSMAGSMIYFYTQKYSGINYTNINTLAVYGIRYNFKKLGKSTVLSASAVPGVGLAFMSSSYGGSNVYISFDLPLMLELHTGILATPDTYDGAVGFFAGGGMGINYLNKEFYLNNPKSGFSYGPTANAGFKINTGRRVLILRGSYLYNLNNELPDLKGVGILWGLR